jgi:DNA-directed RNA polymerase specialized sigma subunit
MYYGKDMSLAEIAVVYKLTPSRVSQILSESRMKLKRILNHIVNPDELELEV